MMRICLGQHPTNGQYGLWITKPGFSILTTSDPDNYLFDPSRYASRLWASGDHDGSAYYRYFTQTVNYGDGRLYYAGFFSFVFYVGLTPRPAYRLKNLAWIDELSFGIARELIYYSTLANGTDGRFVAPFDPNTGRYANVNQAGSYAIFANGL